MADESVLSIWTIYRGARDMPADVYRVRRWAIVRGHMEPQPAAEATDFSSLRLARESLPPGLTLIPRSSHDEPQIVESWI